MMKKFGLNLIVLTAVLMFCGCEDSSNAQNSDSSAASDSDSSSTTIVDNTTHAALEYIPAEHAEIIVYGNTRVLMDSRVWKIVKDNGHVTDEFFDDLKRNFLIDDAKELTGNVALWADSDDFNNDEEPPFEGIIYLERGNAAAVYNKFYKSALEHRANVRTGKIGGRAMLEFYRKRYSEHGTKDMLTLSVVLVNENILQISYRKKIKKIYSRSNANKNARLINKSAVAAAVGSPRLFKKVWWLIKKEEKLPLDVDGVGTAVIEVFVNHKELEIRGKLDISDLDVKIDKEL